MNKSNTKSNRNLFKEVQELRKRVFELEQGKDEQKKTEEALNESESRLRNIYENLPDAIFVEDYNGMVLDVNPAACQLHEMEREELIGKNILELVPEKVRIAVKRDFPKFKTSDGYQTEGFSLTATGRIIPVEIKVNRIKYSGEPALLLHVRDITDRKQAEEALRENEEKFRSFVDASSDMEIHVSATGFIEYVSPNTAKNYGYKQKELIGKYFTVATPANAIPKAIKAFRKVMKDQTIKNFEINQKAKSGQIIPVEINAVPVKKNGKIVGYQGIMRDITERKQAEKQLRESEAFLKGVLTSIQDGISVLNPDLTIWYVNDVMKEWYSKNLPLEGKKCFQCYHNSSHPCDPCPTLRCIESGKTESNILPGLPGSGVKWVECYSYPVKDEVTGAVTGIVEYIRDITQQKQAEEQLHQITDQMRISIEHMPNAYILWDQDLHIVEWNKAAEEIFGYSKEEMLGKNPIEYIVPKPSRTIVEEVLRKLKIGELIDYSEKNNNIRKDGQLITCQWFNTPLADENGNVFGFLTLAQDITESQKAEEALKESESLLRLVIDTSPNCIFVKDQEGRYILVNKRMADLHNTTTEALIGTKDLDLAEKWLTSEEKIKEFRAAELEVIEKKQIKFIPGEEFIFRDGTKRWFQTTKVPIPQEDKQDYLMTVSTDITEQKRMEKLQYSIYKISDAAHTTENLTEFFKSMHATISELIFAKNFYIALYDDETESIEFPYFIDEFDDAPIPQKLGKGLTEYVLRTGRPLLATPELFAELIKKGEIESIGSDSIDWLGVPLKIENKTVGVIAVQCYDKNVRYFEEDKDILTFVSDQVAMAIERKQAEEALANQRSFLQRIIDTDPNLIFVKDRESRFVLVNQAVADAYGSNVENLIGKSDSDFNPNQEEVEHFHRDDLEVIDGRQEKFIPEEQITTVTGEVRWLQTVKKPFFDEDGVVRKLLGVSSDITDRKQAHEEISRLKEFNESILNGMTEGVVVLDTEGIIEYVNAATKPLLGYMEEELLGKHWSLITPKDQYAIVQTADERRMKGENSVYDLQLLCKDGRLIDVMVSGSPRFEEDEYIGSLAVFSDITDRKEAEEEREKALQEAQNANEVKNLFLANMSHEIRTPLNTILGFTDLIEDSIRNVVGEEERKFFNVIKTSGERLMHTVHEVLDISQIEAGAYIMKIEDFNLIPMVQEMVDGMQMMAEEKKLKLEFHPTSKHAPVRADRDGISKSISNIIDNAIKYTEKGKITLDLTKKSKSTILTIQDTGIGMSQKYLNKIFEAFSQESEGYTKKYQGIGLGMAIVKGHLDINQVDIAVDSAKGKGTTFKLTFPNPNKISDQNIEAKKSKKDEGSS